jgi:hypothetical protein
MSERYSKIFSLSPNLYTIGSPIVVKAGALLKDNEKNLLIAQLKLQNISDKAIKLVKVEIHCHDSIGRPIDEAIAYEYRDLHIMRGTNFGTQNPIKITNSATRALRKGYIPIIAHAERYKPYIIDKIIGLGAKIQLNSSAMTGVFGPKKHILNWIDNKHVIGIGSDIHGADRKAYPNFLKAVSRLGERYDHINKESNLMWNISF